MNKAYRELYAEADLQGSVILQNRSSKLGYNIIIDGVWIYCARKSSEGDLHGYSVTTGYLSDEAYNELDLLLSSKISRQKEQPELSLNPEEKIKLLDYTNAFTSEKTGEFILQIALQLHDGRFFVTEKTQPLPPHTRTIIINVDYSKEQDTLLALTIEAVQALEGSDFDVHLQ